MVPGNEMRVQGNSFENSGFNKISELPEAPPSHPGDNISFDDDAAVSIIQNPLPEQLVNIQQDMRDAGTAVSSLQMFSGKLVGLRMQLNQMEESAEKISIGSYSPEKAAELQKEITQVADKINDLVGDIKNNSNKLFHTNGQNELILTGDAPAINLNTEDISSDVEGEKTSYGSSGLLDKIKEQIRKIGEFEGFLLGVKQAIEHITTTMQFDLSEIMKVEENIARKHQILEIDIFSLSRNLARAHEVLIGQAKIDSEVAVQLLKNPEENIVEGAVVE